jgi:Ca2+-binding RTX toxin-like protein
MAISGVVLDGGGVLRYEFDGASDTLYLFQSGAGNTFLRSGGPAGPIVGGIVPTASVTAIVVDGGGGDDLINASGALATTPVTLVGGAGADDLVGNGGANTLIGDLRETISLDTGDLPTNAHVGQPLPLAFAGMTLTGFRHNAGVPVPASGQVLVNATVGNGDGTGGIGVNTNNPNGDGSSWGTGTRALDNQGYDEMLRVALNDVDGQPVAAASGSVAMNVRFPAGSASVTVGLFRFIDTDPSNPIAAFFTIPNPGAPAAGSLDGVVLPWGTLQSECDRIEIYVMDYDQASAIDDARLYITNVTFDDAYLTAPGAGNDTLNGAAGADALYGGGGDDTFRVTAARDAIGDLIVGGTGIDTLRNATTVDTIVLTDFRSAPAFGLPQTAFGMERLDGAGKEIRGRDAAFDGAGNDVDVLSFGGMTFVGVTALNVRSGADRVVGPNTGLAINGGAGADVLIGGLGPDALQGEGDDDTLDGGGGNDLLAGGAGADALYGGTGADRFSFLIADINGTAGNPSLNEDTVHDFAQGVDLIHINTSVYGQGALAVIPGTGPTATGAASRIVYDATSVPGETRLFLPGTGGNIYRRIRLLGTYTLTAADFQQV